MMALSNVLALQKAFLKTTEDFSALEYSSVQVSQDYKRRFPYSKYLGPSRRARAGNALNGNLTGLDPPTMKLAASEKTSF